MQVRYAAQNDLDPEHANQIAEWTRKFGDVPDRAPVVALSEIEAEDWTLLQGEGWLDD